MTAVRRSRVRNGAQTRPQVDATRPIHHISFTSVSIFTVVVSNAPGTTESSVPSVSY